MASVVITGTKQGTFKGEGIKPTDQNKIPVLDFGYEVISPRDAATGLPTGKRQHHAVTFVKNWGAATPQIFQALISNESLKSVLFEFTRADAAGKEAVFQTVTLTNAAVSGFKEYMQPNAKGGVDQLDLVSLTFQKIEITNNDGKTTASDDWSGPVA
jgi:type VI secretion system secreted protein Hcp